MNDATQGDLRENQLGIRGGGPGFRNNLCQESRMGLTIPHDLVA